MRAYQAASRGCADEQPLTNRCAKHGLYDFPCCTGREHVPPSSYREKCCGLRTYRSSSTAGFSAPFNGAAGSARNTAPPAGPLNLPPGLSYNTGGFLDMVRTSDIAISVTRLMGRTRSRQDTSWITA